MEEQNIESIVLQHEIERIEGILEQLDEDILAISDTEQYAKIKKLIVAYKAIRGMLGGKYEKNNLLVSGS